MRTSTDSILFEDRSEIGHLIAVLEEWLEDHPDDGKEKMVQELISRLDRMSMEW